MVRIGSNIESLRAQRALSTSSTQLSSVYERLSSGQRINRASDDAAGLAIADKLRAERRVLGVASRNLNDAISSLSIADGGLSQQTDILIRLKELAQQSANGTLSYTQRRSLNAEYQLLVKEFGRIGDTTSFNGIELLHGYRNGNPGVLNIQAGIDGSRNSNLSALIPESGTLSGGIQLQNAIIADYNASEGIPDGDDIDAFYAQQSFETLDEKFNHSLASYSVKDAQGRNRTLLVGLIRSGDPAANTFDVVSFLSTASDPTQFLATTQGQDTFFNYWLGGGDANGSISFDTNTGRVDFSAASVTLSAASLGISSSITIDFTGALIDAGGTRQSSALEFSGIESSSRALNALDIVSTRLEELSSARGLIGSAQSRIQSALEVNGVSLEARAAAETRIRDVDIAAESSALIKLNILQQVGAAILAQANQQPALALTLLR